MRRLDLDRVLLLLSAMPPHKDSREVTPFEIRWKMLQAVSQSNPWLVPLDLESRREGPSYTIDTLKELEQEYGHKTKWFLLIGLDCAVEFTTWKSWEEILDRVQLVVYGRPGQQIEAIDPIVRERMLFIEGKELDISSTEVRRKVSHGESIQGLVPPEVEKVITEEGRYLTTEDSPSKQSGRDRDIRGEVLV